MPDLSSTRNHTIKAATSEGLQRNSTFIPSLLFCTGTAPPLNSGRQNKRGNCLSPHSHGTKHIFRSHFRNLLLQNKSVARRRIHCRSILRCRAAEDVLVMFGGSLPVTEEVRSTPLLRCQNDLTAARRIEVALHIMLEEELTDLHVTPLYDLITIQIIFE